LDYNLLKKKKDQIQQVHLVGILSHYNSVFSI